MIPLVTPAEMQAADRRTIAAGTPEATLMDRAAHAVAWEVRRVLGGSYGRRIVVVCGKGNNGGDGRIAATVLRGWGMRVDIVDLDEVDASVDRKIRRAHCVIDAMYGTGFRGVLEGNAARIVGLIDGSRARVVAVDIPSGVDGSTGATSGPAVTADRTVTFAAPKPGLWFFPGREHAGRTTVVDIGIDLGTGLDRAGIVEAHDVAAWIPRRPNVTHKWNAAVLVVGGSGGMTGAPMLTARAAMRAGAGMVWAALPGDAARHASGSEVITRALADHGTGDLTGEAVTDLLTLVGDDGSRFGAMAVGPGLGRADATAAAVRTLVSGATVPVVLDADGLTAIADDLDLLTTRTASTVLTPHDGEFVRLRGAPPGDDRIAAARALAADTRCVVVLKGPTTVTADPDGRVLLNPTGTPALATAGTGDVLTGIIGAFLAEGMNAFHAAAAAAFVHGRAAGPGGHTGILAGDLPEAVALVLRDIVVHHTH
ncbi:MAG: NAD(P)H-hydrate dehydratase [Acidimicrobiia bacterium]